MIATARPGAEADFATGLGAPHTVDYTGDVPAQVRAIAPRDVDAVLHLAGDGSALADLLAPGGTLASTLGFGHEQHPAAVSVMANPSVETLQQLATDVAAVRIRVPVTATYPLEEAPQALADYRAGALESPAAGWPTPADTGSLGAYRSDVASSCATAGRPRAMYLANRMWPKVVGRRSTCTADRLRQARRARTRR